MDLLICIVCGGFVLRGAGQVNLWLDSTDYAIWSNIPRFLIRYRNLASLLVVLGLVITYLSAVAIGWCRSRWFGSILTPVSIHVAHIVIGTLLDKRFPLRITHSFLLNPISHLFVLPYLLLIVALWKLLGGGI
jgi:hypothetical protein